MSEVVKGASAKDSILPILLAGDFDAYNVSTQNKSPLPIKTKISLLSTILSHLKDKSPTEGHYRIIEKLLKKDLSKERKRTKSKLSNSRKRTDIKLSNSSLLNGLTAEQYEDLINIIMPYEGSKTLLKQPPSRSAQTTKLFFKLIASYNADNKEEVEKKLTYLLEIGSKGSKKKTKQLYNIRTQAAKMFFELAASYNADNKDVVERKLTYLLEIGADINELHKLEADVTYKTTALIEATKRSCGDLVNFLVSKYAKVTIKDSWKKAALYYAQATNNDELIKLLNDIQNLAEKYFRACANGDLEVFISIAPKVKDLNRVDSGEVSINVESITMLNYLLCKKAINLPKSEAIRYYNIAKRIIQSGIDPCLESPKVKATFIQFALGESDDEGLEIAKTILLNSSKKQGVDLTLIINNLSNNQGDILAQIIKVAAVQWQNLDLLQSFAKHDKTRPHLAKLFFTTVKNHIQNHSRYYSQLGHIFLNAKNSSIYFKDSEQISFEPFSLLNLTDATPFKLNHLVDLLLEAGVNINSTHGKARQTVLMLAAESLQGIESVRSLLEAGAIVNIQDQEGNTAIEYACTEEIKALLARYQKLQQKEPFIDACKTGDFSEFNYAPLINYLGNIDYAIHKALGGSFAYLSAEERQALYALENQQVIQWEIPTQLHIDGKKVDPLSYLLSCIDFAADDISPKYYEVANFLYYRDPHINKEANLHSLSYLINCRDFTLRSHKFVLLSQPGYPKSCNTKAYSNCKTYSTGLKI
jgi:ankyrin repeat protein